MPARRRARVRMNRHDRRVSKRRAGPSASPIVLILESNHPPTTPVGGTVSNNVGGCFMAHPAHDDVKQNPSRQLYQSFDSTLMVIVTGFGVITRRTRLPSMFFSNWVLRGFIDEEHSFIHSMMPSAFHEGIAVCSSPAV